MFKIDFNGDKAVEWSKRNGEIHREERNYRPKLYISGDRRELKKIRSETARKIYASQFEEWRTSPGKKPEKVLRLDVNSQKELKPVRNFIRKTFSRPKISLYHAGLSPQFKYCIEQNRKPKIDYNLNVMELNLPKVSAAKESLKGIEVNGSIKRSEEQALRSIENIFYRDPDVIMVDRAKTLELVDRKTSFCLGRTEGLEKIAGENTINAYGKTVHSPSRYSVSGRVVINKSASFMLSEAGMKGLHDLVRRTWKPLQEVAWASIGNILTAIEIRQAYKNNILTPWKNSTPEIPKKASTMRKADRGGFIFNPKPKVYYDIHELDFASLFPNIMVNKNISPETVNCNCCNNSKVPELDYTICEKQIGFIPHILGPIIRDRAKHKQKNTEYSKKASAALKWILVSCFGYMGHAHASYGKIECHQAIQAFDRKIMVETKEILEKEGYEIKHGIIDSLWGSKNQNASSIEKICQKVSENIGIELEHEHHFEWIAFVPRKNSNISTLNRYFGKTMTGDIVTAGIEIEQSSTPKIVKECQRQMIENIDNDAERALEVVDEYISKLRSGQVSKEKLLIEKKITQNPRDYKSVNRSAEAAKRMKRKGMDIKAGQKVRYVVRDQEFRPRVLLDFEELDRYDKNYYIKELESAANSILRPFGLNRDYNGEASLKKWI